MGIPEASRVDVLFPSSSSSSHIGLWGFFEYVFDYQNRVPKPWQCFGYHLWAMKSPPPLEISSSSWVLREEVLRRRCLGVFVHENSSFGVFEHKNTSSNKAKCFWQQKHSLWNCTTSLSINTLIKWLVPTIIFWSWKGFYSKAKTWFDVSFTKVSKKQCYVFSTTKTLPLELYYDFVL